MTPKAYNISMNMEQYKKEIFEALILNVSAKEALEYMEMYKDAFESYYNEKWTPSEAAAAMICGY